MIRQSGPKPKLDDLASGKKLGIYYPRRRYSNSVSVKKRNAEYQKLYITNNHEQLKKEVQSGKARKKLLRLLVMDIIGGRVCVKCGFTDIRALQVDHKNGGGSKELKAKGNASMYYRYLREPKEARNNLQVLCANCNQIKIHEERELYPKDDRGFEQE